MSVKMKTTTSATRSAAVFADGVARTARSAD
jgi:hypothetical protein